MKTINGFSEYKISKDGKIYSKKGKVSKICNNSFGYPVVNVKNDGGKWRIKAVHRLLAETYIPNPNNLPEVNHKDRDRQNYNLDNLEWVSKSDNNKNRVQFTSNIDKEVWAINYLKNLGYTVYKE